MHVVMATCNKNTFAPVIRSLESRHLNIRWADSGAQVLAWLAENPAGGLVITDEVLKDMTGRDLVAAVVMRHPMTHCVAASPLSREEFHDRYEGYGVLMQLPLQPDDSDGQELIACLKKVNALAPEKE